jgi:hypothetical protein
MNTAWQIHRPWYIAVLLLWGWQTDFLWLALAMGLILEAPRLIKARVDISFADFERLWSFSSVVFLGVIFYLAMARQGLDAVGALTGVEPTADQPDAMRRMSGTALTFLRWLPFILFPFTASVAWSRTTVLPWSIFSMYEQARAKRQPLAPTPEWAQMLMHPGYFYIGVTLFAATTTTSHALYFLPLWLAVLMLTWWPWRSRSYGTGTWVIILLLLATTSIIAPFGHRATRAAWAAVEERFQGGGGAFGGGKTNPDQLSRRTAFGAIGALKQSGAILLRATTPDDQPPGLLREAAFNRFHGSLWATARHDFGPLDPTHVTNHAGNQLSTQPLLTITRATAEGDTPLALPNDGLRLHLVGQAQAEVGGLGAVRLRGGLPLAVYQVERGSASERDPEPQSDDLTLDRLDAQERAAVLAAAEAIGVQGLATEVAMERLERYFGTHFSYSLWQAPTTDGQQPLVRFLTTSHAGHCEYFATATVLLLRAAGIPARYAVGFSMNERYDQGWIARGRDAHAWCLVWNHGQWQDFDTTPGSWREQEQQSRPWFEGVSDRWADLWYRFDIWRQGGGRWQLLVFGFGMVVLAWIAWRQVRGSRWRRVGTSAGAAAMIPFGLDSEFFKVLALLEGSHHRPPHLPPGLWIRDLILPAGLDRQQLAEALGLHERLRFDPAGLPPSQRRRLAELSQSLHSAITTEQAGRAKLNSPK